MRTNNDINFASPVQFACSRHRLKLPMLSKDGTMISALDEASGVTKIFKNEPPRRKQRGLMGYGFFLAIPFGNSEPCAGSSPFSACALI